MTNDRALENVIAMLFSIERRGTTEIYGLNPPDLDATRDQLENLRQVLNEQAKHEHLR